MHGGMAGQEILDDLHMLDLGEDLHVYTFADFNPINVVLCA